MSSRRRSQPISLLVGSVFCAFVLMLLPLPEFFRWLRPDLILLVLLYWLIRAPESIGVIFAWALGLVFDGVIGSFLGQHALAFSCIAYLVLQMHQRIRMWSVGQQSLLVFLLLVFDQMIANWINMVVRGDEYRFYLLISPITGALVWPLLYLWLNRYQRLFATA